MHLKGNMAFEPASVEKKVEIPGAAKQSATVQTWK